MKKEEHIHHKFDSISEAHRAFGLPKPMHPLISLINGANIPDTVHTPSGMHVLGFYKISFKPRLGGRLKYGQHYYDFDEGGLLFASPNQLIGSNDDEELNNTADHSLYTLLIHPDFLLGYPLAKKIKQFGLEFATRLIDLGNTVIITGRDGVKLDQTKKRHPELHTFQSDVSKPEAITQLYANVVKQFPALNILINNAGEMRKISLHDKHDLHDITREIEINLMGPIRMVQQFLPHLKKQKSAAILNVTSGLALIPFPISPIYGATKSGLRSYTKSLRVQLKKTNIKVFELIAPGAKTPLNDKFAGDVDSKTLMEPGKLVDIAIKGMMKDHSEIYPGLAALMNVMSRLAPGFLLSQTSKAGAKEMEG